MNPGGTIQRAARRGGVTCTLARMGSAAQDPIPCTPPVPFRREVQGAEGVETGDLSTWIVAADVAQEPLPEDLATVLSVQYIVQTVTKLAYRGVQGYELQLRSR